MKHQETKWKEIELAALDVDPSTGMMHALSCQELPGWARKVTNVTGAWCCLYGGEPVASTGLLSTDDVHGHIDIERSYSHHPRFKYDRYFFIKVMDDRVFQLGPFKDVEYGHHLDERPAFLVGYYSEST